MRKKTGTLFNVISTLTIKLYKQNSVAIPLVSIIKRSWNFNLKEINVLLFSLKHYSQ